MKQPDFVVCGNVVRDLVPGGWVAGGTVVYATRVARALGRRVGVLTRAPADVVAAGIPADVALARVHTDRATEFENRYAGASRTQLLSFPGEPLPPDALPPGWDKAAVALIGSVYHEISPALVQRFQGRVGLCAQGFLRTVDTDQRVRPLPPAAWDALPVLRQTTALFLSREDLMGGDGRVPQAWLAAVPLVLLTDGPRGVTLFADGAAEVIPAFPATELDPTGAGDTFAAAFMIALDEGHPARDAAQFAAAAAALAVQTQGPCAPTRNQITQMLLQASPPRGTATPTPAPSLSASRQSMTQPSTSSLGGQPSPTAGSGESIPRQGPSLAGWNGCR